MKFKYIHMLTMLCIITLIACSQNNASVEKETIEQVTAKKQTPHMYGGWYCPDNLNGFPAVDIKHWRHVPVVNGRMATKEETQNGASLIFVDMEKYPNAEPLPIQLPQLARFYNEHSKKEEIIIVIQAIRISNDSIVGFRYLNGGNGSAHLDEIRLLSDEEIEHIPSSRFVAFNITINATQYDIWEVLTKREYAKTLQPIFDQENTLEDNWKESSAVNFKYLKADNITAVFADELFGNQYIQIDYDLDHHSYVQKFLLLENQVARNTTLQIVCGPYVDDYEDQKMILNNWVQEVKALSEPLPHKW